MAKGYKSSEIIVCGSCLRSYVASKILKREEFKEVSYGHCEDCYNCLGHEKKKCQGLT